jgi:hypothetical protein
MVKIFCEKTALNLDAKIIFGGIIYDGYIEGVFCEDAEYLMTFVINIPTETKAGMRNEIHFKDPSRDAEDINLEKKVEVHFQTHSGVTINLNCEVIWFSVSQYDYRTEVFGMEIINPPEQYREFLNSLNTSYELVEHHFIIDNVDPEYESS